MMTRPTTPDTPFRMICHTFFRMICHTFPRRARQSMEATTTGQDSARTQRVSAPRQAGGAPQRVLAVDVGNTSTHLGIFEENRLLGTFEHTTPARITPDEARLRVREALGMLALDVPGDAIISCVVPALADAWRRALVAECPGRTLVVGPGLKTGVRMRYDDPAEVGSDRVADVVAARETYGAPVVAVDLGTTTNFEVVDAEGAFAGGIIAPGVALGAASLARAAARLPTVELRAPAQAIGKNTRTAIQSGVVLGEAARIDGLIDLVFAELGQEAPVVVTGNFADTMSALLEHDVTVDGTLTLRGLDRLWLANRR